MSSEQLRAIVVEPQDTAPAGLLGPWAQARGIALDVVPVHGPLPEPADGDVAVVLGSECSLAHDVPSWAAELLDWLRAADGAGVPVLGVCFGAQALAAALGGAVHRLDAPEIGWVRIATADAERVPAGPWMTWHEDGLTLPPLADELAANPVGTQAFCLRGHLGVQFHPEVTREIVETWTRFPGSRLPETGQTAEEVLAAADRHAAGAARNAERLFDGFLARAGIGPAVRT